MKKFLISLLAVIALPTTANATNYVECEAIYSLISRTQRQRDAEWDLKYDLGKLGEFDETPYNEVKERALKDYKKRGCYGL
ncbi:hypothetical protein HA149_03440 [Prochlorococcus marinus XMU1406]|uniref:hypothetical protein n=1 Tax=Prochlorococcus marinus TaxID=1219 RepID=UPI001ADB8833|nr:hypothetical protein [Prochlorococcus marinus]MBO8206114.1 hypothetical protein [Prochlorococcus marinus XMU1406]MCR8543787.1 hypothetical protein [Prochlorococcus marinus XMU1427]